MRYESNDRSTAVGMASCFGKEAFRNTVMENRLQGRNTDPRREKRYDGYDDAGDIL